MRVTALAGGTGAAKLLRGLAACLDPGDLTIVGNTGDDTDVWGLHVSPDLDTVTYALAGLLDVARGWGRADETFRALEAMAALGGHRPDQALAGCARRPGAPRERDRLGPRDRGEVEQRAGARGVRERPITHVLPDPGERR